MRGFAWLLGGWCWYVATRCRDGDAYIVKEDPSSCAYALGYIYGLFVCVVGDDGEDLALQPDGRAIGVFGLEGSAGGFGE